MVRQFEHLLRDGAFSAVGRTNHANDDVPGHDAPRYDPDSVDSPCHAHGRGTILSDGLEQAANANIPPRLGRAESKVKNPPARSGPKSSNASVLPVRLKRPHVNCRDWSDLVFELCRPSDL
jgi:hypothetical protein